MEGWMHKLAREVKGWHVTVGLLIYFAGSLAWFQLGPLADLPGILDDQWGFTPEIARQFVTDLGVDGRETYRTFLLADFAYPLLFVPGTVAALLLVTRTWGWWPISLAWLPVLGTALDWLENTLILRGLSQHPASDQLWNMASRVSVAKLTVVSASFALVVLALLMWLVRGIMNPVRRG